MTGKTNQVQRSEPKKTRFTKRTALPLLLALIVAPFLQTFAQAAQPKMRTYVSGTGSDNGECTETSPCRTLQVAINQTSPGGTIYVLGSANYGPLNITKAINITGEGAVAGVTGQTGQSGIYQSAITISAGANDVVNLRGLDIDGAQIGLIGVYFYSGQSLNIQKSVVRNFSYGVVFAPNGQRSSLFMSNAEVINNKVAGVLAWGTASAVLHSVRTFANAIGIVAWGAGANLTVANTIVNKNTYGIGTLSSAVIMVTDSVMSENAVGISADQAGIVRVAQSTLSSNGTAWQATTNGQLESFGNNNFGGNRTDGTVTATISLK